MAKFRAKAPKGLHRGYAVKWTSSDGERHTTRKVWRKKVTAEKWARNSPPAWNARVVKAKRNQ